ncbi:NYN domain-containing protein [Streptacidiphilus sp. P02-A3a]|uniref:NYN domain-containing protein n=1 Tax=Streptacidiphilus sp. P02-A3a TaxID=2704468 RepID=UPI0015FD3DA6|nr:NYN domain-containing protein [Streptacidiphilus sp. P02-A3a]QMU68585.1 NYN domain-containing protein [Streptacidiphilus sp. P02-A3a]
MDRCVVLVDAGYLLGAAASLLAGESSRSRIAVEHAELIRLLRERAEAETGLPLLRIYWFDAAPDRRPMPDHRRLRVMPRVTVRLGALTRADGRMVQKGVDAAMHAELSELARNRACADVVLVTGDGDLLPGMTAAKDYGVAVHLWAVQAADGDFNQSEDLVAEADERRVLDREWITCSIRAKEPVATCAPADPRPDIAKILSAPRPVEPAPDATAELAELSGPGRPELAEPHERAPEDKPAPHKVPTPKEIAAGIGAGRPAPAPPPATPSTLRWSSDRGWVDRLGDSGPGDSLPTLAQLTTAEQKWADREEDITTVGGDPTEVGQVFARRWTERLGDPARLSGLWSDYPRVPHRVDGELLRYAARFGLLAHKDDQIDEHDRYAIRAGFWREIATRVPGGEGAGVEG